MKTLKFIDSCGSTRNGVELDCKHCGKKYITRTKYMKRSKYCSQECSRESRKVDRIDVKCANCNKAFKKKKSSIRNSKSGLFFCSRICKDNAQRLGGIKEIQPDHYGTAIEREYEQPLYRQLFKEKELICNRCGYDEFKSSVDIHHIDKDRSNNKKSNLIPLCANCHRALHHNKWDYNS